jgi:hypothetical protein
LKLDLLPIEERLATLLPIGRPEKSLQHLTLGVGFL